MRPDRSALLAGYGFDLDAFQVAALDALDAGHSVLVAAPTGSGKTVVAEYAVARALAAGRRAFYTAPIKALSNQKFADLRRRHGDEAVGLLTGDNSINADAPIVVMTTEVLRNMIYARASALDDLAVVVLDEVHFLQDAYRGPVWEEVIIHLDHAVRLVCLSATVSNAEEVAEWITTVRGRTECIVEERRPVRLDNLFMAYDRTHDRLHVFHTLVRERPNPDALKLDQEAQRGFQGRGRHGPRRRLATPTRLEVIDRLEHDGMLPAIYFIFSRNACDEAAAHCLRAGVRLTTPEARARIRQVVDTRLAGLGRADLEVLGYDTFVAQLEAGIAPHHAGMVPPFKEAVEACFVEGLVKVVFATETLAVGINMPARSVVIEKVTKYTGERHAFLTPGQYTQLTGRAGRRGIDVEGHAVVLWNPFVTFEQVAALAASRAFHLQSAFRPTYNMAANLVQTYSPERARHLLNLSFAQYQADRDLVRLEARLERRQQHLAALRATAQSPFGDVQEYRAAMRERGTRGGGAAVEHALAHLRPGDVIYVEKGSAVGRAVVLTVADRKGGTRVSALDTKRTTLSLGAADFADPPVPLATIDLPQPFAPHRHDFQKVVVSRLEHARLAPRPAGRRVVAGAVHDVERDPELEQRLKAAAQADRVQREVDDLRRRVDTAGRSVARQFDRVLEVLTGRGYVDGWSLTASGRTLAQLFHECDLLVAECLREGLLDGLDAASLAALASVFTYEHRSPEPPVPPWFPSTEVRRRFGRVAALSAALRDEEEQHGFAPHRSPDPTFVAVAYAWAAGEGFAEVVEDEELSGGDFVRNIKQLIDLLRQVALVAVSVATRRAAQEAVDRLFRGVVAASAGLAVDELADPGSG